MTERRLLVLIVLSTVAVIGGFYLAGYALASERLARGTTIAGVEVGGMSPERARAVLADSLADADTEPLRLTVDGRPFTIGAEEAGLEVDVAASVAQVPIGASWNPADMWQAVVGGSDYDAVVVVIDDLLATAVAKVAEEVDVARVEGSVAFRKSTKIDVSYPREGRMLDQPEAVRTIRSDFEPGGTIELSATPVAPRISRGEVSRALKRFANPAMSGAVTYRYGSQALRLQPKDYAVALSMVPRGERLVPRLDRAALRAVFRPAARGIDERAVDARFEIREGKPFIVKSRNGVRARFSIVADTFLELAAAQGAQRTRRVDSAVAKPTFSTADARALGIKQLVSEFSTSYPHAPYRNTNIGRAAQIVNGTLLKPGEIFSLNGTVGERTRANGFTEGFIISDGILREDLGGGVSQIATTIFNAAYFAGFKDVEHKAHSFYINRYPVGREATVVWPYVDLKFRVDTGYGVFLTAQLQPSVPGGEGVITVRLYSTKVWDITSVTGGRYNPTQPETRTLSGEECVPNEGYEGFTIDVVRQFRRPGKDTLVKSETLNTVYTPSDTVICE